MFRNFWALTCVSAALFFSGASVAIVPGNGHQAVHCGEALSAYLALPKEQRTILRVAAIPYAIHEGRSPEELFIKLSERTKAAAENGAALLVFPELLALDLLDSRDEAIWPIKLQSIARNVTPRLESLASTLAQKYSISILAGTWPREVSPGEIRNTAFLSLPDGRSFRQDKLFLTPEEKKWGWQPGTQLNVIETPWGRTSILICYDCEFPVISNMLAPERPEILLIPSMTGQLGFNRVSWSAQARAVEHHLYVILTGISPTPKNQADYFAQARIIGPQESHFAIGPIAEGKPNNESTIFADLDLSLLRASRASRDRMDPAREQNGRELPLLIHRP